MGKLVDKIQETKVELGSVAIFWIAQAGFVFKTPAGMIIYVDPYLTNYVEHILPDYGFGFKRIMATLIEADEVEADYVISTHSHPDHFDAEAIPVLARNPRIHFIGAPDCRGLFGQVGLPEDRFTILDKDDTLFLGDCSLTGVAADHGNLAPDALGLLFNFNGIKVWQVGDSAYRPDLWQDLFKEGIDIILPPINGVYGNLNGIEAAKLAHDAHAKVVIPCHFWMFALHYGNPAEFLEACKQYAPEVRPLLMTQGERFVYLK